MGAREKKSRNELIRKLVMEGKLPLVEIGKLFAVKGKPLSRQRVHQIAFGYGYIRNNPRKEFDNG